MAAVEKEKTIKGGEFLIKETDPDQIFIPAEFNEEQKMVGQACDEFVKREILPNLDAIDAIEDNPDLLPTLLNKAGELGLLATAIPEEYGGIHMNFNSSMMIAEKMGSTHSFCVAFSAHTGIGTLPILYYGNEEQKSKYLPKLAQGEWKAAYCLTEPDSGSDANAAKSRAKLTKDGKHYIINGQKMWITNGGFADLFIVFAKIDDDEKLSAFIVEKEFGGMTMNPEEKKMGIKGSSTRHVFFTDCKVPVENLLSDRENGFKIAVNILNIGRIKLGAACLGGSKAALNKSIEYANERKQFGQTIGSFGAIKSKLGEIASRIYADGAANYRAGQNIDDAFDEMIASGMDESEAKVKSVAEFAIECAIIKVHSSELVDYVVDEGVQIFGGMGFSAEGPMDRAYRDARINRIFEGTNEINRMLIIDMMVRKAMRGQLDLMAPAMEVGKELTQIPDFSSNGDDKFLAAEKKVLKNLKKAGLLISGAAFKKFMQNLKDEQEILISMADMLIEIYVVESALLRTGKLANLKSPEEVGLQTDLSRIYLHRAVEIINRSGKEALYAFAEGDELRMMLLGLKRFTKIEPFNLKDARRRVADYLLENNKYLF